MYRDLLKFSPRKNLKIHIHKHRSAPMPEWPKVSFIIPISNEEATIRDCLDSILSQNYPIDKIEILIADGNSIDRSCDIVKEYRQRYDNIHLFDNPEKNTSIGRNICVEHATGDMLMNFSGHAVAPENLLPTLVKKLLEQPPDVIGVGCSNISPDKQNFTGETVGAAFLGFMAGSGIFMQNSIFQQEKFVNHMAFTCYRKTIFNDVGLFDPEFWCGQDAEFDIRVNQAGYKILYTPDTAVYHYKRKTIRDLFRQQRDPRRFAGRRALCPGAGMGSQGAGGRPGQRSPGYR